MPLFAHVTPQGMIMDVQENADVGDYKARWGRLVDTAWADHVFKKVPPGTRHNAIDNGDDTFTNPVILESEPQPKTLTPQEDIDAKLQAIAEHLGVDLDKAVADVLAAK